MKNIRYVSRTAIVGVMLANGTAYAQVADKTPGSSAEVTASVSGQGDADIIVTGTRATGVRAADSPAPIQFVGNDVLKRVGQTDLNQALAQLLPSVQVQAFALANAAYNPSIKLRGLSPNHVLVSINGKRRHGTANVAVSGGAFSGAAAPDLSLIPEDAIDHIEVLQDGAAAQYGTDAIAGVVNFILKKKPGLDLNVTGGHYIDEGGGRYDIMTRFAAEPVEGGFLSVTAERSFRNYSFRGGTDARVTNTNIAANAALLQAYPAIKTFDNYPYVNRITGDGRLRLTNVLVNGVYDITPDIEAYAFGTYSRKIGRTFQNYRPPNVVVGKSTVNAPAGTGDVPFPGGFSPQQVLQETDYAVTGGIKGRLWDTTFDLSSTLGEDSNDTFVDHSANAALYFDSSSYSTVNGVTTYQPGSSPSKFYSGAFKGSQWTNTLDVAHEFDMGLGSPLTVAGGLEYRRETYQLLAGEPSSYYVSPYATTVVNGATVAAKQGGAQSFFGYLPANASFNDRKNVSEYLNVNVKPISAWTVDAAVRHEHYSDFGDTIVWKLTSRYDFSPALAVRGTVSSGFRAPTLAEAFYSGLNVGPTQLAGVFPPNSVGARSLGLDGLKPEKSLNLSAGIVAHPAPRLAITVDAYSIRLRDRIVQSGLFYGANYVRGVPVAGTPVSQSVLDALRASGVPVDSVLSILLAGATNGQSGVIALQAFVNGVNTRTTGVDFQATYNSDLDDLGKVDWSLTANYNKTKITKVNKPPSNINQAALLLDPSAQSLITDTTPKFRATGSAYWSWRNISLNVRESFYGKTSLLSASPTTGLYTERLRANGKFITDIELGVRLTPSIKASIGANNVFNVYPTEYPESYRTQQYNTNSILYVYRYPTWSPIGINGGYYYGRISLSF